MSYFNLTPFAAVLFLTLGCSSDSAGSDDSSQQQQPVEWRCTSSDKLCVCEGNGDPEWYTDATCASQLTCCRLDPDNVCGCTPDVGENCKHWYAYGEQGSQAVLSCPPP